MKPNKDITNLANKLSNEKWMILPSVHKTLMEQVSAMIEKGYSPDKNAHDLDEDFDKAIEETQEEAPTTAIVECNGVLMKHPSMFDLLMGAFNIDDLRYALQNAVEDETIKQVVIWFNSPGGVTTGIEELGRYIKECSAVKPVYAFTDTICASAAYWLASQCDEVVITPSAIVGSIGVFSVVLNDEKAMDMAGLKVEAFSSGRFKLMGHTFHTLTKEEKDILQTDVDKQHDLFKQTIKSRRPDVDDSSCEGLTYEGQSAVETHLADATVDSIEELLEKLGESMKKENETKASETTVPTKVETAPTPVVEAVATPVVQAEAVVETPKVEATAAPAEPQAIPGLPGVKTEEDEGEPDGDECECEKCGGTGKAKKAKKKADDDKDDDDKPTESPDKMETTAPVFQASLANWKEAINTLQTNPGPLTMREESANLKSWRDAQDAFRNQKV